MVPVRDIPKASTCVSTGRGETVGNSSMSLPVDEDMLNNLGLCDRIDNLYIAGTFEDDLSLEAEAMGWSLVEVERSSKQRGTGSDRIHLNLMRLLIHRIDTTLAL